MFVDRITIECIGGDGGNGCLSFRREKYVPRGGPDGGDGGHGGSVILEARAGVDQLAALAHKKTWKAPRGRHGMGANRQGKRGEDIVLYVPPGTLVYDAEGQFVLKDLVQPGDRLVAARGGKGGYGNARFKSSVNQAPREHTPGEKGEVRRLTLELKVIADVGLVGKPNAGKSTLLSRLTKARPEIAAYPFTTKHPHLGRVTVDWNTSFVLADIPGLIEGAHAGVGLGHEFLRHIERSGILVHLVEPAPMDGTDPVANYHAIRDELVRYSQSLEERPEIVAVTKAELPEAEIVHRRLQEDVSKEVLLISAVTGAGLDRLLQSILRRLQTTQHA